MYSVIGLSFIRSEGPYRFHERYTLICCSSANQLLVWIGGGDRTIILPSLNLLSFDRGRGGGEGGEELSYLVIP